MRNPAFDVTPAALVTAIVTERGVHRPPYHLGRGAARVSVQRSEHSEGPCTAVVHAVRSSEGVRRVNVVDGIVEPPAPGDVVDAPVAGHARARPPRSPRPRSALKRGEVALVVLAGGMATRMGGVVKALVEALPGKTFLDSAPPPRRRARAPLRRTLPLLAHDQRRDRRPDPRRPRRATTATASPCSAVRVAAPHAPEGESFRDEEASPAVHATGHGDLPEASPTKRPLAPVPRAAAARLLSSRTSTTSGPRSIPPSRLRTSRTRPAHRARSSTRSATTVAASPSAGTAADHRR